MLKIIGRKKLMTQVFDETGNVIPVTVIDCSENVIANKNESKVEIGFGKKKNFNKAEQGNYKKLGYVPILRIFAELSDYSELEVGDAISLAKFESSKITDITGYAKGRGFQGVVKRHGFKGGPRTHGQSDRERAPGAIGARTTPGRVWKNQRMPGRMGNNKVTVKNLEIMKVDKENKLIIVKGAVPGMNNSFVEIKVK